MALWHMKIKCRGAWVAWAVKQSKLDFGSGPYLRGSEIEPHAAESAESA